MDGEGGAVEIWRIERLEGWRHRGLGRHDNVKFELRASLSHRVSHTDTLHPRDPPNCAEVHAGSFYARCKGTCLVGRLASRSSGSRSTGSGWYNHSEQQGHDWASPGCCWAALFHRHAAQADWHAVLLIQGFGKDL